jgi:ribosomal protein S18 acetylase RimI-like enzyme
MKNIVYKKLAKKFPAEKLKKFYDAALPGKSLLQCANIIKKCSIVGAFNKKELIGISRSLDDSVYGFITDIIVKPEFRKKGIGKKLVKAICNNLKDKGIKIIHCSTNKKLIGFYKAAEKFEYDSDEITLYRKNF